MPTHSRTIATRASRGDCTKTEGGPLHDVPCVLPREHPHDVDVPVCHSQPNNHEGTKRWLLDAHDHCSLRVFVVDFRVPSGSRSDSRSAAGSG
jgi:hypothetical protein